ncbi:MAG: hemolysin family protein [Lactobacillales bacterium]|jgi:CBS domain containing-hemolysin-like protein|nr:hemolysin family protein [Lactobacillales bacterium]
MSVFQKIKSFFSKSPEEERIIETIEEIMDEREERGDTILVDPDELSLLKNLFRLRDIRAGQIMIPRIDIQGIPLKVTTEEIKNIFIRDKFTRLPVYEKTLDNIVGIIHVKDLLVSFFEKKSLDISALMMKNVLFVPDSIRALDLLREMQRKHTEMAVVVDEYGGTDGLITLEDLLEEIVGEIEDEHDALDAAPALHKIAGNAIETDARVYLEEIEKITGPFVTEEDRESDIDTVGGLVFHLAGRLPHRGEVIIHPSGVHFQVMDADARHIKQVKITHFDDLKKAPSPQGKKKGNK